MKSRKIRMMTVAAAAVLALPLVMAQTAGADTAPNLACGSTEPAPCSETIPQNSQTAGQNSCGRAIDHAYRLAKSATFADVRRLTSAMKRVMFARATCSREGVQSGSVTLAGGRLLVSRSREGRPCK